MPTALLFVARIIKITMRTPPPTRAAVLRAAMGLALVPVAPPLPLFPAAAALADVPSGPELQLIQGKGWSLRVPSTYYRPKSRAKAGSYDDTVFVAADYGAGRTASVSITGAADLLVDAGDPLPLTSGLINSLRDVGKPNTVARMLAGRRDGDPLGRQLCVSEVRDAVKISENEIAFTLLTLKETATSMTTTAPGARRTYARTVFLPGGSSGGVFVTAWASGDAPGATCEAVPCPACTGLQCACPPPKCSVGDAASASDSLEQRIVGTLQAGG